MGQKVFALCIILSAIVGCSTTNTKTNDGNSTYQLFTNDLYRAKVAFCENIVTYDHVTQFVGNDRTAAPEVRKAQKDNAWSAWQVSRQEARDSFNNKIFKVTLEAEFGNYDKESNRMSLVHTRKFVKLDHGWIDVERALPHQMIYNYFSGFRPSPLPLGAPNDWAVNYFSNSPWDHEDYVLNGYSISQDAKLYSYLQGSSGNHNRNLPINKTFSVFIDLKTLAIKYNTPIYNLNRIGYLDLSKFDFLKSFGVYPDTGNVIVNVEYLFEIKGCHNGYPKGQLREVVVNAGASSDSLLIRKNEIARIVI